jgi:hypothetical protein
MPIPTRDEIERFRTRVEFVVAHLDEEPEEVDLWPSTVWEGVRVSLRHAEGGWVTIFTDNRGWVGGHGGRPSHFGPDAASGGYRGRLWMERLIADAWTWLCEQMKTPNPMEGA